MTRVATNSRHIHHNNNSQLAKDTTGASSLATTNSTARQLMAVSSMGNRLHLTISNSKG
jgi:hypothetical protein